MIADSREIVTVINSLVFFCIEKDSFLVGIIVRGVYHNDDISMSKNI